ncbi:hypothetical protein Tco_0944656 [Tanacetum coccineum]
MEKPSKEKDSQEEALGEFNSTLIMSYTSLARKQIVLLDQAIKDVAVQNNVPQEVDRKVVFNLVIYEEVTKEVVEMPNDQDEALYDQKVADDSLDDEKVEEERPNKRIRVTQKEMVKDEKPKKRWSRMKSQKRVDKDPLV